MDICVHYIGADKLECENMENIQLLMEKIKQYRQERSVEPALFEISLQRYSILSKFSSKLSLVRDASPFMREMEDGWIDAYSSYYDLKDELSEILDEYSKHMDQYEEINMNDLAHNVVEISHFMEEIWNYYLKHSKGFESVEKPEIPEFSLYQSKHPLPRLILKDAPEVK
jgi:hypothetical protein